MDTVNVAEDSDHLILRCFESQNRQGPVTLRFGRPLAKAFEYNLMEEDRQALSTTGSGVSLSITPYQVRAVCVSTRASLKRGDAGS